MVVIAKVMTQPLVCGMKVATDIMVSKRAPTGAKEYQISTQSETTG